MVVISRRRRHDTLPSVFIHRFWCTCVCVSRAVSRRIHKFGTRRRHRAPGRHPSNFLFFFGERPLWPSRTHYGRHWHISAEGPRVICISICEIIHLGLPFPGDVPSSRHSPLLRQVDQFKSLSGLSIPVSQSEFLFNLYQIDKHTPLKLLETWAYIGELNR